MDQQVTSLHEDKGLILGLTQEAKDPVLPCELQSRLQMLLLWLWYRLSAAAPIGPLAWEPPYAAGEALKRKKKIIFLVLLLSFLKLIYAKYINSTTVNVSVALTFTKSKTTAKVPNLTSWSFQIRATISRAITTGIEI